MSATFILSLPFTWANPKRGKAAAAAPEDMDLYYSKEQQRSWGVVGIEIALLDAGAPHGRAHATYASMNLPRSWRRVMPSFCSEDEM